MTSLPTNTARKLHGTFEIDEGGRISYFFSAFDTNETNRQMIGRSFYDYLQNISVNDELEWKIKTFIAGSASTDSFNIDYFFEGFRQKVLVLLARVRKRGHHNQQDLIVIDIKPEQKAISFS